MRSDTLGSVVRRLRCAVAPAAAPAGTDAELVRTFVGRREAGAFEAIVRRHGPMVLGVCRRVLRESADADDAFQATFLVLVRKAAGLKHPERLAGWLHQVAHRTACKVRSVRLARAARETELLDVPAGEPPADFVWRELRPVFDQELNQLPDKLRLPTVLCFLEGYSKGEAARTLGWPEGTLAGRLQQAREKLRVRFVARGLTLSAGALAVALFEGVGTAAVPDRLVASTLNIVATGRAGMAGAWALADGVIQAMVLTKLKATAAAVFVAGVVGTGAGVVLVPGAGSGEVVAGETPKKPGPPVKDGARRDVPRTSATEPVVAIDLLKEQLKSQLEKLRTEEARLRSLVAKGIVPQAEYDALIARIQTAQAQVELLSVARTTLTDRERDEVWSDYQRNRLALLLKLLEAEIERETKLVDSGTVPRTESRLDKLRDEMTVTRTDLKKLGEPVNEGERFLQAEGLNILKDRLAWEERMLAKGYLTHTQVNKTKAEIARTEAELKKLEPVPVRELDRETLELNLRELKDRLAYEQRMVAKGFMTQTQLERTKLEVARAEIALTKHNAPKAADPRRAVLEELLKKAEEIVAQTAEGVKKGTVPQQELLNAEMAALNYKLRLVELGDRPWPAAAGSDERGAAAEALIWKAEEVVARTADGFKRGIIPQQELLNAEMTLLNYKLKALELTGPPVTEARLDRQAVDNRAHTAELRQALVQHKENELRRAEQLQKQNVVSVEEVRRLRIDLAGLKAEAAEALGDHAATATQREAVVAEWEAIAVEVRKRIEQRAGSRAELRTIEVVLAEAKVEALKAAVRRQLAEIVRLREQELAEAKTLFDSKAISAEALRKAETALTKARLRLAEGR